MRGATLSPEPSNAVRKPAPVTAVRFAPLPDPFRMTRGGELRRAQVAYECWGQLNKDRSNAILLFTGLSRKAMTPMTGKVKARSRSDFDEFIRHPGQEFVFVLSGEVTVLTECHAPVRLKRGESIYIDSGMGHLYTSTGNDEARILVVCVPSL